MTEEFDKNKIPRQAKILLIKLRSIGDVVYNTAVYAPLKRSFPDAHLTVLVERASYDLVRDHPDVDEALCFDKGSLWKQLRFYWKLFRGQYDVAIDMHEGTRGAIMCFVTQAPFRVGHKLAKRSFLYNVKLNLDEFKPQYPIDYQVALIKKMGVAFSEAAPAIHISEASRESAKKMLDEKGIRLEDPYCIIHPGTRRIYNQWQPEKFARLAQLFALDYGLKVIVTCGPGEEEQARAVTRQIENAPYAFITGELQELAAMTEGAEFAVCHNGGFMHLSSVLGTPVISLFGSVHPRVWKPLGERDVILYKQMECSPCNHKTRKKECYKGNVECLQRITVEDALQGVDRILGETWESKI